MQKSKIYLLLLSLVVASPLIIWISPITAGCAIMGSPHSSVPECAWRSLRGEPLATQNVNDAADILEQSKHYRELESLADRLFRDYADTASDLPEAPFAPGRQLPIEHLPKQFYNLGGSWQQAPHVILRDGESPEARQLRLHWGNGRHAVVVFASPPSQPPEGFHIRQVSPRTYVVAIES